MGTPRGKLVRECGTDAGRCPGDERGYPFKSLFRHGLPLVDKLSALRVILVPRDRVKRHGSGRLSEGAVHLFAQCHQALLQVEQGIDLFAQGDAFFVEKRIGDVQGEAMVFHLVGDQLR